MRSPGETPTQADIAIVSEQLGRPARDIVGNLRPVRVR
jgi:hypothetical protein